MKKTFMTMLIATSVGMASAQISEGGFPLSKKLQMESASVPIHHYPLPDWKQRKAAQALDIERGMMVPEIVRLFTATDIRFPESGTFTYLPDGRIIWRVQVRIDGAPAIGFY